MPQTAPYIILASKSPRRRQLLTEAGYRFVVHPPDDDAESGVDPTLPPEQLVRELAYRKAASVAERIASKGLALPASSSSKPIILGCDTVVECNGQILGKPDDREHARQMLETLCGQRHHVFSGLCLWPLDYQEKPVIKVATTSLSMDSLSDTQLNEYLDSDGWRSKAGAFGYQDRTGWVHVVEGSRSNVVGLPMELLAEMLATLGYASPPSNTL